MWNIKNNNIIYMDKQEKKSFVFKNILYYDESWCKSLGIFNPYIDPFEENYNVEVPMYDITAYQKYPRHNFVYDKLWIAQSQNIKSGELENVTQRSKIKYPIFIKPRWGHKSASSKNCYKIKNYDELKQHLDKEDMIWTEFIDAQETMTDYLLLNGTIVYQMTSVYSEEQNGFIDDYKYIDEKNQPPDNVTEWVKTHMNDFTGVVNAQYRGNKIIEISLRLSRGGAYMKSTGSNELIQNINNIIVHGTWDYELAEKISYKPFYSFKCYTKMPIIYLIPQHVMDMMMKYFNCKPFYEYFFEPSGKIGMVFFQFLHEDFKVGKMCQKVIEYTMALLQLSFVLLFVFTIVMVVLKPKETEYYYYLIALVILWLTRFINPLSSHYSLYKAQKQQYF